MTEHTAQAPSVQSAIQATENFFQAALADRNDNSYIAQKLVAPRLLDDALRVELLKQAGSLLQSIHGAVKYEQVSHKQGQAYDSSLLLALYKLIDFLLLEGVYPSLPFNVGLLNERRAKSLFYRRHDPSYVPLRGSDQLELVLSNIIGPILKDVNAGIEPLLRHRALPDIIAGNSCLAHRNGLSAFLPIFSSYLEKLPITPLFASFTTLLRDAKDNWFRSMISEQLSILPLRPNGVLSTINFLAASHRPPQAQPNSDTAQPSLGPALPLEALHQASKLLSSVPRAMSADAYFSRIAPQLLALLDSQEEVALRKAAAFIISNGILGKRSIGAPGTIGWSLFADPILRTINPVAATETHKRKIDVTTNDTVDLPIVSHQELERSLQRLSNIVLSHPSPALTGRLVRPLLLPLWALSNYRGLSYAATEASKSAFALVSQFLNLIGTSQNLQLLSDNLLWDGTKDWMFGSDEFGGIAIRKRHHSSRHLHAEEDIERDFARINGIVQNFCRLLNASKVNDNDLNALFRHVSNKQLGLGEEISNEIGGEQDLLGNLIRAKLLEALVERFSDRLMRNPNQLLDLIDQVLQQHIQKSLNRRRLTARPSFASLANIVQHSTEWQQPSEADSINEDALMVALSLLNAFSASYEPVEDTGISNKLQAINKHLTEIEALSTDDNPFSMQVKTTIALLRSKISCEAIPNSMADTESIIDVQNTLNLIMADVASELPPIRRSALHALQALIKSPDAPLDVPPLTLLLLDLIRTDKEEFVYLAAIQTTVQLAVRRNLGFVTRLLTNSFQDVEEQTGVDGRLRIGEALASLIDELSEVDVNAMKRGDVVRGIAESLLAVAARRGQRRRELLERQREDRLQRRKRKEAERAWDGDVPDVLMEEDDGEYEDLDPREKQRRLRDLEAVESIVKGWEDTGYEEDVRIRASALSILGRLFENCADDLRSNDIVTNAIELCLPILSLELDPAKAILRRAAALAIFGILKGIDAYLEAGNRISSTELVNGEEWLKVQKVLQWVVDTDFDELTVSHSEAVLEGLEAVRMKVIASAVESASQDQSLDGSLRGLNTATDINDSISGEGARKIARSGKPKIEEIE